MGTWLPCPDALAPVAPFYAQHASLESPSRDRFVILISSRDHMPLTSDSHAGRESPLAMRWAGQKGRDGIGRCLRTVSDARRPPMAECDTESYMVTTAYCGVAFSSEGTSQTLRHMF